MYLSLQKRKEILMAIRIFTTGGTIDGLDYDSIENAPQNHQPMLPSLLKQANMTVEYELTELMAKDSRFITGDDRRIISRECEACSEEKIVITQGTLTMPITAKFLGNMNILKTIVLVGSAVSGDRSDSDALFNLGAAITAVQILKKGVYITMNGRIFSWENVRKNTENGVFETEKS